VVAVADHQTPVVLVALVGELGDVGIDPGLQRLSRHPPGALPHDLIDQRRIGGRSPSRNIIAVGRVRNYGEHLGMPSRPEPVKPGETSGCFCGLW
jgi:hypothetical protein